jgi:predicted dehydrogenase
MEDIGVGIVGYGLAGKLFHKMLIDVTDGMKVTAVMSRSEAKLAQARDDNPGALVTNDFDELVGAAGVDLVVLATPHHVHCDQAVAALEAGKPVVTDKIMCRSVAEADRMIAAADRAGKLLGVFHNRRWDSDFLTLRTALDQGLLGDVWSIDIAVTRPAMPLQPLTGELRWRATTEAFGGQLVDWGAHLMDQAVLLGGADPVDVFCDLQYRHEGSEVESEGFVALRYADGLRITVTAGVQTWLEKPHWFVNGSGGTLRIWGIDPQEGIMRASGEVPAGMPAASVPDEAVELKSAKPTTGFGPVPGNWVAYYENVRDALRGEAEPAVTPQQCRDVLRVYERCFRAAGLSNVSTTACAGGLV